ncbi:MAG: hypothetical protein CMO55_22860 [Verrucomicrobiales bacterium]|nr:hypothetical protein [Verrucomicrobiales bacterium]
MKRTMQKFVRILALGSVMLGSLVAEEAKLAFESPNYQAAEKAVGLPEGGETVMRDLIANGLIRYALNCGDDPKPRERAMALAWCVSKGRKVRGDVAKADIYLRFGQIPNEEPLFATAGSKIDAHSAAKDLEQYCERISESGGQGFDTFINLTRDLIGGQSLGGGSGGFEDLWTSIDAGTAGGNSSSSDDSSSMSGGDGKYKLKQSSLHGLLVIELDGSEYAGGASKMNATVLPGKSKGLDMIRFNQIVGDMMDGALNEVRKYLTIRHGAMPSTDSLEISFEERNSIKDGPSAAVACALLLDSVLTGEELDTSFAVTGDMSADGIVQPVGGIDGKIRGAITSKCSHVAIPRDNVKSISDLCITEEPAYLAKIQIFSIGSFDEARKLALHPSIRESDINEAISIFAEVAEVINRPGGSSYVSNRHVQERLVKVLELAPNHESARFLRLAGTGNTPTNLSLAGSFVALDRCSKPMITLGRSRNLTSSIDDIKDSISDLRLLRNTLDPRTKAASDALEDLYAALTEMGDNKLTRGSPRYNGIADRIDKAIDDLNGAYDRLRADPEVQEELNY